MNVKERFEELIKYIEKQVENSRGIKARVIADHAAKKEGMQVRDLSSIFCYLTGETLMNYIKERKMMHVYKTMWEMKEFEEQLDIEELTLLSDCQLPTT